MKELNSSSGMLTFEWDQDKERLEIHFDEEGVDRLILYLHHLKEIQGQDHSHLMTSEWGGNELTSEKQNQDSVLINHVKLIKY